MDPVELTEQELAEIIQENPQVCAEILRDLFYEEYGLEDLRDLLSFAGYGTLKEALNMLPKSCIEELKGYIEDSRENPTSLLNGVEVPIIKERTKQERIASILSTYDNLIENNWRRIRLLEDAARLLFREWFVHLR